MVVLLVFLRSHSKRVPTPKQEHKVGCRIWSMSLASKVRVWTSPLGSDPVGSGLWVYTLLFQEGCLPTPDGFHDWKEGIWLEGRLWAWRIERNTGHGTGFFPMEIILIGFRGKWSLGPRNTKPRGRLGSRKSHRASAWT